MNCVTLWLSRKTGSRHMSVMLWNTGNKLLRVGKIFCAQQMLNYIVFVADYGPSLMLMVHI